MVSPVVALVLVVVSVAAFEVSHVVAAHVVPEMMLVIAPTEFVPSVHYMWRVTCSCGTSVLLSLVSPVLLPVIDPVGSPVGSSEKVNLRCCDVDELTLQLWV